MKEKEFDMTAKTFFGLEDLVIEELKEIGAKDIQKGNRVVTFKGDKTVLYRSNLWLRTALKVLVPVARFNAPDEEMLYKHVKKFNWGSVMSVDQTISVDSTVLSDTFTHSKYIALKVKDAIADYFRARTGERPSVDIEDPDIRVHIHVAGTQCILSLDASGEPLNRRGYRKEQREAPLNETLAAALVKLSGWTGEGNLVDPMCGSGTIPIEAAMIALNMAPGLKRKFAFQNWKDYDPMIWKRLLGEALMKRKRFDHMIYASDISDEAIEIAINNMTRAGIEDYVRVSRGNFIDKAKPAGENGVMIVNPPYGERIGDRVEALYEAMGNKFKQGYEGFKVWMITSNKEALKKVGLRPSKRMTVHNGGLECKYVCYDMYKGSKR
ncbi:THUMP domain-containing class I SAM-dependent RNA methyltransferase [Algivirga pacifica]|uniref:THUMP domain-containing protein n=1 Tax=Algivirga pacifica TaxID=1162670 RepID=A0ABP9D5T9_9BACT